MYVHCTTYTCDMHTQKRVNVDYVYTCRKSSTKVNLQLLVPEAICCCLQTCNSCMLNVLVDIPLRQSHRYYH